MSASLKKSKETLEPNMISEVDEKFISDVIWEAGPMIKNITKSVVEGLPKMEMKVIVAEKFKLNEMKWEKP